MRSSSRNHNFLSRTSSFSSSSSSSVSSYRNQTTPFPKPAVQTPTFSSFSSLVCFILSIFILIFFRRPLFAILGWIVYVIAYTLVLGIGFVLYLSREDAKQWVFQNVQILLKIGRRSLQTASRLCLKDGKSYIHFSFPPSNKSRISQSSFHVSNLLARSNLSSRL
jgi:hypothetical protein